MHDIFIGSRKHIFCAAIWALLYVAMPSHSTTLDNRQSMHTSALAKQVPQQDSSVAESGFSGHRISLHFQDIAVRSLLQVIADFTDLNIVASEEVNGSMSLRLRDVPWDQALSIILQAKGLGVKRNGNVLWVAPKEEIDTQIQREFETARKLEALAPVRTQRFQIHYAKAEDLKKHLVDSSGQGEAQARFLSLRGSVIAEPRTNQLFVTDTDNKLAEVQRLLQKLDVPVRQVLIEARIVEARDSFGRALGVKFGASYNKNNGSIGSGYAVPNRTFNEAPGFDNSGTSAANPFINLPAVLSSGVDSGTIALSIFNSSLTRFLSLELSAMESEGMGKVISNPRLLTADQTQAIIEQGTEYPYTETAPNGATTISFKKAVLKLEVVPQITPEGNIILDLDLNKDSRGETTLQGVAIDTKHIKTRVLVENGGTVVIGGIFETEEIEQNHSVPVLGDIPIMGNLFKNRTKETSKREMLVFITPSMVSDMVAIK